MNNFLLVVFNFLYLADVLIVGGILLGFLKLSFANKVEEKVFAFAFGNIFYSLLFIYLGFFHLLYSQILLLFYVLPIIFYFPKFYRQHLGKSSKFKLLLSLERKFSIKEYLLFSFIAFLLLPIFPHLFSFPTSWDVVAYHLVLPKIFLRDHMLSFYHWFTQTAYPIGIESLFGLGELLKESRISNFIVFDFVAITTVYFIYGLRHLFKLRILLLALILFLFRKILYTDVAFNPYVDFPLAFYGLLISVSLFKYFQNNRTKNLFIALYLGFFTILIKFSGSMIAFSLIATLGLSLMGLERKRRRKIIASLINRKYLFIGSLLCLAVFLFFLRNYLNTGNPVYPYLNNIFKGLFYNEADLEAMMTDLHSQNLTYDLLSKVVLRMPIESAGMVLILRESLHASILIIFAGLSLLSKKREIRYPALFSLLYFGLVVFMVGFPSARYTLPLIPMMALLLSLAFWDFIEKRRIILIGFMAFFVYSFIVQASSTLQYLGDFVLLNAKAGVRAMLSYEQAKQGLAGQDNWWAIDYLNKNLDVDNERVLALFDNRLYYYQVPVVYADPSSSPFFANQKAEDVEELYEQLRDEGITYLMVNKNWGIPAKLESLLFEEFLEKKTVVEASYAGTIVYKIKQK